MACGTRLLDNWSFTQIGGGQGTRDGEWIPVSSFPTTVHVELLKINRIPDPFIGLHDWDVQWIGESDWAFRSTFEVTDAELACRNVDLVIDGLDTYAIVKLNGQKILESSNQFISHRLSVKKSLRMGSNELLLHFESTFMKGREIEKEHGKLNLWNGDSSRLHVRKAQYNYGWDWGPILMTVGPWKSISLQTSQKRLTDLDIRTYVSESLDVKLTVEFSLSDKTPGHANFVLKNPDGSTEASVSRIRTDTGNAELSLEWEPGKVQLWYPVGYGAQPIYTVQVTLVDEEGHALDNKSEKIAFRRACVIQNKLIDEEGLSFFFEINNIRIFCGGSNWIPADSFLTTMTAERYRSWLMLLKNGNQNMVRVWGGGIYEHDDFYAICDELGILVWQDFMFGCGQYPAYDSFLDSVREEVTQNVKRLRHHPSIVIFAGNNEDYQLAESLNLELDYDDEESDFRKTNFPGRYIYERLLPEIVSAHCDIFYHRGSPYSGNGKPTTDRTFGDLHQWNVWHGSQQPWHNWDVLSGRFVSEFGMQGFPNIRTVDYWLGGDKTERFPQSRTNNNHNKAAGFEHRLELYLVQNFRHSFEMESYVYYTQIMQAEALASAYRLWRREWRGEGREYTAGALVWQINDCWPVTSWAIVDYFQRPKPAYFAIARELQSYTIGITRKEYQSFYDDRSSANFVITTELQIWGTNSTLLPKHATLSVTCFDLYSDWRHVWEDDIVLAVNSSTELYRGPLPGQPDRTKWSESPKAIIVSARILDKSKAVLARHSNWPEPYKFIKFPPVENLGLAAVVEDDGETVTLKTSKPVKGLVLDVDGDEVKWSDQAIDLVPDDPQRVCAIGLKGREVKLRFLGDGSA